MKQESELLVDNKIKKLIFRCDVSNVKRLKQIALDNDTTLNVLLLEGVKYILNKYENKKKELIFQCYYI